MNRFATIALPLLSLVLATRCDFRFNNPVEQCPPEGCGYPADAGVGDAEAASWFSPTASRELVGEVGETEFLTVALASDEPFLAYQERWGESPTLHVRAATRSASTWKMTNLGDTPAVSVPGARTHGGTVPALTYGAQHDLLFYSESLVDTWETYQLADSGAYLCSWLASPGPGGAVEVARVCEDGVLRHGHWNGDRTSKVLVLWEDVEQVGKGAVVVGFLVSPVGTMHLLLFDSTAKRLVYFRGEAGTWTREVLQENYGGGLVATLDPRGEVLCCWVDAGASVGSTSGRCARRQSGQWAITPLFTNVRRALGILGIALDSSEHLQLLVVDGPTDGAPESLSIWGETGGGWQIRDLVRASPRVGLNRLWRCSNLALDSAGVGHFAIVDGNRLYHVQFRVEDTPRNWFDPSASRQLVSAVDSIGWTSLGIDSTDKPFILFGEGASGTKVRASTPNAGGWQTSDIVLMGADFVSGFAFNGTNPSGFTGHPDLLFFERTESTWSAYPLSSSSGFFASALRSDGSLDAIQLAGGALRYAHWNGDRTSMPALRWADVGTLGASAVPIGLLRDPQSRLHLLVVDPSSQELVYFLQSGGLWSHEVLRSHFTGWAAMALDPAGELAYCWSSAGAVVDSVSASCERKRSELWTSKPIVSNLAKTNLNLLGLTFDSAGKMLVMTTKWEKETELVSSELWRETDDAWTSRLLTRSQGPVCPLSFASNLALDSTGLVHVAVADCQQVHHLQFAP